MEVASFPGLPTIQFLIACTMQRSKLDSGKTASNQELDGGRAWERSYMEAEEWRGFPLPCINVNTTEE